MATETLERPAPDVALIEAERELHEAGAALEKWCAENPHVDHDQTEEWARYSTIYWDRILGADPAGADPGDSWRAGISIGRTCPARHRGSVPHG